MLLDDEFLLPLNLLLMRRHRVRLVVVLVLLGLYALHLTVVAVDENLRLHGHLTAEAVLFRATLERLLLG